MDTVFLIRTESSAQGTFSQFAIKTFKAFGGELPSRNNQQGKSCIPAGTYICRWLYSNEHKRNIYHITNVPNRTDVEVHSGNYCGDKDKGFKSDVLGCLLLGKSIGLLDGQKAVLESKEAIQEFEKLLNQEPFKLIITDPV